MAVAGERYRGLAYRKAAGTFRVPRAVKDIAFTPAAEALERDHHLNSFGDFYAPDPGMQTFDGSFQADINANTFADMGDLLEGGIGELQASSTLVFNGAGTNNDSEFAFSSGSPDPIVKITTASGSFIVPVDSDTGGQATFGVKLPTGQVPTNAQNGNQVSGGCFNYILGTSAQLYEIELDRRTRPNEVVFNATTAGCYGINYIFERGQRLGFSYNIRAGAFTKSSSASVNISDPAKYSTPFIAFQGDFILEPASTPVPLTQVERIKTLSFSIAPDLINETATKGLDGSGTVLSGSDITGYTRMALDIRPNIVIKDPTFSLYAAWENGTPYKLFGVHYPGAPGSSTIPSNRMAFYMHRIVQSKEPQEVIVDGAVAFDTEWVAERDTTLTGKSKFHLAFFN